MERNRLEPVAAPPVEVLERRRVAARAGSGKAMSLLAGRTRRRRSDGREGGNSSGRAEHLFGGHRRGQHGKVRGGGGLETKSLRWRAGLSSGGQAPSPVQA